MNLETQARDAAARLREAALEVDSEGHLEDLVSTRRRRTLGRLVAGAAGLALLAGVAVGVGSDRRPPPPVGPSGSGTIVTDLSASGGPGALRLQTGDAVRMITELPDGRSLVNPDDLEISPDGTKLALVGDDTLQVLGLGTDTTSTSVPCRGCMFVSWIGYRVGLMLVSRLHGRNLQNHVYTSEGDDEGAMRLPDGVTAMGYAPDRLHLSAIEYIGPRAHPRGRISVVDDRTTRRTPLRDTETKPGELIGDLAWSPDGTRIGYVVQGPRNSEGFSRFRLMVASADGAFVRQVADLGRCVCFNTSPPPTFAWSPDGGSVVVAKTDAVVVPLDGSASGSVPGHGPVDWGPPDP